MKEDEASSPIDVGVLGAEAVVAKAAGRATRSSSRGGGGLGAGEANGVGTGWPLIGHPHFQMEAILPAGRCQLKSTRQMISGRNPVYGDWPAEDLSDSPTDDAEPAPLWGKGDAAYFGK